MRKKKSNIFVGLLIIISFLFSMYYILDTPI